MTRNLLAAATLLLCSFHSLFAQTYTGPPVGTKWYYTQSPYTSARGGVWTLEITADTILFTRPSKITRLTYREQNISSLERTDIMQFSDKRIYTYDRQLNLFLLLYDFGALKGDSVKTIFRSKTHLSEGNLIFFNYRVDSIFTAQFNGTPLTQQNISWDKSSTYDFADKVIWEKIGSLRFFFPQAVGTNPTTGPARCYDEPGKPMIHFVTYPCDSVPGILADTKLVVSEGLNVQVYPNPATGATWRLTWSGEAEAVDLQLHSAIGAIIWSANSVGGHEYEIPARNFPAGVYFLTIRDKKGSQSARKLVKP